MWLLDHEPTVRLGVFGGLLVILTAAEWAWPGRAIESRMRRWFTNYGLLALGTVLVRIAIPVTGVGIAAYAQSRGIGLFSAVDAPSWVAVGGSVLALDLVIYWQHRLFHRVPLLWRLHSVHHADSEYDVSTGLRFHPVEIGVSMAIKFGAVLALGAPPVAVVVFEVILNAMSMWTHANLPVNLPIDRVLRWFVVTPDMHRVHHSVERHEHDSNFCFNVPWWDRLFGSYRAHPDAGYDAMEYGLRGAYAREPASIPSMLVMPLRSERRASRDS